MKTVGIIGGMGPFATIDLIRKVVQKTPARIDQEHIPMLIDHRPQVPDRTAAILKNGPSPVPMLRESALLLERWGAELIAIPCNTAHHFVEEFTRDLRVPVVNMLHALGGYLASNFSDNTGIILLATTGSIASGLFQRYVSGVKWLVPSPDIQRDYVMAAVYGEHGVKRCGGNGTNRALLLEAIEKVRNPASAAIVAGCTEIGASLEGAICPLPIIDPLDLLAESIVAIAFS